MPDYDYLIRGKFPGLPLLEQPEEAPAPEQRTVRPQQEVIEATPEAAGTKGRRQRRPVSS